MKLFKDLLSTLAVAVLLAGSFLAVSMALNLSIPEPHQRPVFFIGIVLFAVVFRLLMAVREE